MVWWNGSKNGDGGESGLREVERREEGRLGTSSSSSRKNHNILDRNVLHGDGTEVLEEYFSWSDEVGGGKLKNILRERLKEILLEEFRTSVRE